MARGRRRGSLRAPRTNKKAGPSPAVTSLHGKTFSLRVRTNYEEAPLGVDPAWPSRCPRYHLTSAVLTGGGCRALCRLTDGRPAGPARIATLPGISSATRPLRRLVPARITGREARLFALARSFYPDGSGVVFTALPLKGLSIADLPPCSGGGGYSSPSQPSPPSILKGRDPCQGAPKGGLTPRSLSRHSSGPRLSFGQARSGGSPSGRGPFGPGPRPGPRCQRPPGAGPGSRPSRPCA